MKNSIENLPHKAKAVLFVLVCIIVHGYAFSQTTSENYVKTIRHKKVSQSFQRDFGAIDQTKVNVEIAYFDGLGRPIQHIVYGQSGNGKDLITHIEYDDYGRQEKDYLPYERSSSASLNFASAAESETLTFYNTPYFQNTTNPYSKKKLENSPLSRVQKQAAPGNAWAMESGKEIKFEYNTNTTGDVVYFFKVNNPTGSGTPTLALETGNNGRYASGQLYKTVTKDENWEASNGLKGTVVEFKNKMGQVVLKRHYSTQSGQRDLVVEAPVALNTYYVYDNYGNLTFVLPPKLSEQIVNNGSLVSNRQHLLNELGYQYKYDHRNRLVQKKLPGKTREYIAYDALNRVVAVGPVPNPFMNGSGDGWVHTKYDAFNRVAYTFWTPGPVLESNRNTIEVSKVPLSESHTTSPTTIDGVQVYYTNDVNPKNGKLLTVNYYDDYRFGWSPSSYNGSILDQPIYYNNTNQKPKGMPTGSWVRILENDNQTNATTSYSLYDNKSRSIRSHSNNYLGGHTRVDTEYDFIGKVLKTVTTHKMNSAATETTIEENFSYSVQERLLTHTHKVNNEPEQVLANNTYDALGQLQSKKVGGDDPNDPWQKVDYKYNIRGWLTDINNISTLTETGAPVDLFAFKLKYNQVGNTVNDNVIPLYNGNIAETEWRTASDNVRRRYGYTYDYLNRLTDAWFQMPETSIPLAGTYNEHLSYDNNGNILTLERTGELDDPTNVVEIDELEYTYDDGNKLLKVTDATNHSAGFNQYYTGNSDHYEYDAYGNLVKDRNKNIDNITYNHLQLPKKILFSNGYEILYLYNANGVKVKKTTVRNQAIVNTHYLDGFQYTENFLDFFHHAEGYVKGLYSASALNPYHEYVYTYTDHLGNIRLRYTMDPQTDELKTLEEDHYYPFGLKHKGYNPENYVFNVKGEGVVEIVPVTPDNRDTYQYKFGGMEYQDEFSIGLYDFGARNYDPALGRWMNIDPLAEQMRRHSPYNYAFDNPIFFIDPDGMMPVGNDCDGCPKGGSGVLPISNNPPKNNYNPDNLPSGYANFTPSQKTLNLLEEGKELLSNVFGYEAKLEAKYGVGGGVTAGPLEGDVEVNVASVSVSTTESSIVKLEGKAFEGKASGSIGPKNNENSIQGSISYSMAEGSISLEKDMSVNTSSSNSNYEAEGTMGRGNLELNASTSSTIGIRGKIGPVRGGVSANLYNAAAGTAKLLHGGASYVADYISNVFSW